MNSWKKTLIQITVLLVIFGLLVWHAVSWHSSGMYDEMFRWLGTGKAYLTVLHNISFMIVSGVVLGMLLVKITDLAAGRKFYSRDRTREKD